MKSTMIKKGTEILGLDGVAIAVASRDVMIGPFTVISCQDWVQMDGRMFEPFQPCPRDFSAALLRMAS